jgi:hypothetical protein
MATIMQRFEGDDAITMLSARGDETTSKMMTEIMRLLVGDPQTLNLVVIAKTVMHDIAPDDVDEIRRLVSSGKAGICLMTIVSDVYIEKR